MVRQKLKKLIEKATGEKNIHLEVPLNSAHGDYATNVAIKLKKNPKEIVKKLKSPLFQKIEVADPGFINFYLSEEYILKELNRVLKGLSLVNLLWKNKKVAVEFTDPNPFKQFHIGHLYSNIVGETICRLLEVSGAKVKRMNYQGDVGLHVAKAVWALAKGESLDEAYAFGNDAFENDPVAKAEIEKLNEKIYARTDPKINRIYDDGRVESLAEFEKIYKRLGTKFDFNYFESKVGKFGQKIVKENLKKGIFEKSEGAIIFPGEKYGLHKRVFINSKGLPTYEAKELGLASVKYKNFPYDFSIIVTGSEITDYFKVVLEALKIIYPKLREKTLHIPHGMVRLSTGKMSSRKGNIIKAQDLLDQVKQSILKRSHNEKVAEQVALGAVKYSFLRSDISKGTTFDPEASLSMEGDTGPYLQYTYARFKSILRKTAISEKKLPAITKLTPLERRLVLVLLRFSEIVEDAASLFSPSALVTYLHDTAMTANEFYHSHPVAQEKDESKKAFRISLSKAVTEILKQGLNILGISAPEKM